MVRAYTFPAYNARMDENPYKAPLMLSSAPVRKRLSVGKLIAAAIGGLIAVALLLPIVPPGRTVPPHATIIVTSLGFFGGGLAAWLLASLFSRVYRHW